MDFTMLPADDDGERRARLERVRVNIEEMIDERVAAREAELMRIIGMLARRADGGVLTFTYDEWAESAPHTLIREDAPDRSSVSFRVKLVPADSCD